MKITQLVASAYQGAVIKQEKARAILSDPKYIFGRIEYLPGETEYEAVREEATWSHRISETIRGVLDQVQAIHQGNKKSIMDAYDDAVDDTLVEGGLLAMLGTMTFGLPRTRAIQKTICDLLAKK